MTTQRLDRSQGWHMLTTSGSSGMDLKSKRADDLDEMSHGGSKTQSIRPQLAQLAQQRNSRPHRQLSLSLLSHCVVQAGGGMPPKPEVE